MKKTNAYVKREAERDEEFVNGIKNKLSLKTRRYRRRVTHKSRLRHLRFIVLSVVLHALTGIYNKLFFYYESQCRINIIASPSMLRYYAYGIENCVGRTLADIHIPSQGIDDNSKVSFSAEEYLESINNHTHPAFDPSAKNEAERRERIRTKIINDAIDYAEQTNDEVRI